MGRGGGGGGVVQTFTNLISLNKLEMSVFGFEAQDPHFN
jgi:hypothetical protein